MEGDAQPQSAPVSPEAPVAGTAESTATDAAASPEATREQTPPAGTDGSTPSTAAAEEPATEDPKTRRERQRETRRQAAPPPEPAKSPEQIIAEHEATQRTLRETQERQQREQQRYARYIGDDPVDPSNPQSPTRYQQLWSEANTPIPDGDDKFFTDETRELVQRVNRAREKLAELNERRGMLSEVFTPAQQVAQMQARDWLGNELERGLAEIGLDPQAIIAGIRDPAVAIPTIVKQIAAAKDAEYKPQIEDLEDDLAAKDSEIDALKRQLGGAAPQALRGGVAVGIGGALTPSRYAAMTYEERAALRSTPEGRAQIDAMSRSGAA